MLDHMLAGLTGPGLHRGQMLIGGRWTNGSGSDVAEVENPANQRIIGTIPQGVAEDAVAALEAARRAQPAWAALPPVERAKPIFALADLVKESAAALARIIVAEQGKPLNQALGEVGATETFFRYAAESARRIEGDIVPSDAVNEEIWIRRLPHGVVVGLTAWNYPAALAARKLGPALVAGNTFVLKAHELTPFSGIALAVLSEAAGFPPGVINVVTGTGRVVGEALVQSPHSDLITMTGSTRAGKEIYRAGADRIKILRLELGGKAPFIVMDDADIDAAVESAVAARFSNCGQICTCNERMYLHDRIANEFLEKFVQRTQSLRVGDPLSNADIGPKISGAELDKVDAIVEATIAHGAEVLLRGGPLRGGDYARGHWYAPTVLKVRDNAAPAMRQEIFGPAVAAMTVSSFEEALALANDSEFGLSAYVYSQNFKQLMRAAEALQFGEIYFNRTNGELVQGFHTGWGQSGLGGEDGKYGLDGYFRKKTTYVNWS